VFHDPDDSVHHIDYMGGWCRNKTKQSSAVRSTTLPGLNEVSTIDGHASAELGRSAPCDNFGKQMRSVVMITARNGDHEAP